MEIQNEIIPLFTYLKNCYNTVQTTNILQNTVGAGLVSAQPLGKQIKYYRKLKGMEQKELANVLKVSRDTIMDLENREIKMPNIELLNRIFEILDIKEKVILPDYIKFLMDKPEEKIKQFQKNNKLIHIKFAKLIGIDRSNLRKWINGQVQISRKGYEKLRNIGIE